MNIFGVQFALMNSLTKACTVDTAIEPSTTISGFFCATALASAVSARVVTLGGYMRE